MANVSSSNGLEKRPKLRFPGFDEPWHGKPFGDLIQEYSDRTQTEDDDTSSLCCDRRNVPKFRVDWSSAWSEQQRL